MNNIDKVMKELQQKINESMDSVESIQGEGFRNLLAHVMACSQAMRLLSVICDQHKGDPLIEQASQSFASLFAKGSSMLADAYNISEEKCEELMKWVETFDGHIKQAMTEIQHDS